MAAGAPPSGLVGAAGQPAWLRFFGISAVAGYLVPSTGSVLNLAAANFNTALGAACLLTCALATLRTGRTSGSSEQPGYGGVATSAARTRPSVS